MIRRLRAILRRRGGPRVVLEGLLVVQILHLGEHLAQMIQLYALGWPPAIARGVVSNLDVEKVHFVWNLAVLATLVWLVARGLCSGWLVATLIWAVLHTSEHGFLLTRALATGLEGAPGVLGAGGWLARQGWDVPGLTTWTRATVHFAWNTVEVALLALAYAVIAGPRVPLLRKATRVSAGRGATLALVLLIPSTASAPMGTITALAPVEIWVDGLGFVAGVVVDGDGNLYVSDRDGGTVIRVARNQHRTVVASGLDHPMGLALDGVGRLLIAEEGAGRVLRVETGGALTPLATGIRDPRWLAVGDQGVLFISARRASGLRDDGPMMVLALRPSGPLDVLAGDFKRLESLAAADGALFVAAQGRQGDRGRDGVIFRIAVSPDGVAGAITEHGPRARFRRPVGLAHDHLGALYLTTREMHGAMPERKDAVAKLHTSGALTPFAADLGDPRGVAFDGEGHLYVAGGRTGRVLRFRAPEPPALETLPAFTSQSPITVRGTAEANARADLFLNDAPAPITVIADAAGKFTITSALMPNAANTLEVLATTHGGEGLTSPPAEATVSHDASGPTISFQLPSAGAFVRQSVTVQAEAIDGGSGVAHVALDADGALPATLSPAPPAAAVTARAAWDTIGAADGARTLSAVAADRAGNTLTVTRAVIVDNTAPETEIAAGPSGDVQDTSVAVTFTGTDNLTPAIGLNFAWRLDGAAFGAFSPATTASVAGLAEGLHTLEVKARDLAGNEDPTPAVRAFSVSFRPTITSLSPSSGPAGTPVTITGGGFLPGPTQVDFNGVAAIVRTVTPTAITTTVPLDARTGSVTVTTSRGSATGAEPFTVTTSQDFSVQTLPADARLVQGTSTTYTIALLDAGGAPFTGLATLSVAGLPPGVTGAFAPTATVGGGQRRALTVTAAPTATPASATVTITANATLDGASVTRTAAATLDVLPGGRTGALGQVTFTDGAPIAGVRLTLAGATTTSDAGGNFRLFDVPAGRQMLGIDANAAQAGLPIYGVDVMLVAGQATQLAPFRITPPPPSERFVPIANTTAAQVITDPRFPGASVTLPAGVTITGWDGAVKTHIALERLSPEALPVPPPPGVTRSLYQVFFGTPMGGLPSAPLPVTVPNDQDLDPGDKAEIWYYDAAPVPGVPAGWRLAGLGTVSADGSRIVSDPGVGISRFCGVCGVFCILANLDKQANVNPRGPKAGEPVDLGTGLMVADKTDLVLPGRLPAILRRSYNPLDPFGRIAGFELATGPGWTLSIDVVLLQESPSLRRLVLPGNARFAFVLQPDGTSINTTFPDLAGAILRAQPDGGHTLRFKDGTVWRFATGYLPRAGGPFAISGLSLLVAQSDRHGNTLTIARDRFGAPVQVTEPGGRTLSFTVDLVAAGVGRLLTVTDPIGRTVRYGYSGAAFRLETAIDPTGGLTRYTYDASGGMVSITDARGISFLTNEYDPEGRVLRQTQADGGVWTFAYTGPVRAHTGVTVTDPRGHPTIYRLDNAGFASETIDALGQATRHDRDAVGRVTSTSDPLGRVTRFAYDAAGNITRITDPEGNARTFTYEPIFNRMTSLTDPLGQVTRLEYDTAGDLTAFVDPLGHRTTFTYDATGQPLTATDALGDTTRLEYDAVGNLTATLDALGHRTTREYDAVSRLTRQLDALGRATTIGYDALDRVATVLDGLGGITRFDYDPNGNLLAVTDARGSVTTHTYDAMDRMATRTDPLGRSESFTYDGLGNLVRHADRKGQAATFAYDALNRRVKGTHVDATIDFVYDAGGRLARATDSVGGTILNQYDALDRRIAQTTSLGVITYDYDALGRRTTMTAPGQPAVTYAYDPASRLTSITQAGRLTQLEHDPAGRRTRLTLPNQVSTEYRYDAASRLSALVYRNAAGVLGNLTYQYDPTGNRIAVGGSFARTLLPDPIPTAAYDAANRQLTFGDKTMTYDANGNVASIVGPSDTTSLDWDARDRVIGVTTPSSHKRWAYDASSRRVRASTDQNQLAHLFDDHDIVQTHGAEGTTTFMRTLALDEPLARDAAEFYLADGLGSTLALTGPDGSLLTRYTYEPFGRTDPEGTTSANLFQFTGRENDGPGLYYYRARYYDPRLHRFVAEDPVPLHFRAVNELNAYGYVTNNPVLFTDPLGLAPTMPGTNYCGPGGRGPILNRTDGCCKDHDDCYGRAGITWQHTIYKQPTQEQRNCMGNCDAVLCWCLSRIGPTTDHERRARTMAQAYFCKRWLSGAP
jgi:RHS repeat-associated protein